MASDPKIEISLNINWDNTKNLWHIMVISNYKQDNEFTTVASCQYTKDKKSWVSMTKRKYPKGLHRDWLNRSINQFPDGIWFQNVSYTSVNLNFNMICSKCLKREVKDIGEFKQWLIVQKLKYR